MDTSDSAISERTYRGWSADLLASSVVTKGPHKTIYLAGVAAHDPESGTPIHHAGNVSAQTSFAYEQLREVLALHSATFADIVKITAYVTDQSFLAEYSKARLAAFGSTPLSPHTFLVVKGLAFPEMLMEIDVVAVVPDNS